MNTPLKCAYIVLTKALKFIKFIKFKKKDKKERPTSNSVKRANARTFILSLWGLAPQTPHHQHYSYAKRSQRTSHSA
ncbi:hypothetical protein [Campylobacter sp.]|uniref:hypothetical protein n=1 Tax=Campylobacter sp. TaxID=205 RepID=UPI002AA61BF4|nr:hypothetical protein [Campylobacter sp.]MCI7446839.1 hypothetical protein [Campylobacter sp.]